MNETKHTPGPWEIALRRLNGSIQIEPEHTAQAVAAIHPIINLSDDQHDPAKECEANAKLIAAAPEMLQALEEVVCMAELAPCFCKAGFECTSCKVTKTVQAAILKATGK